MSIVAACRSILNKDGWYWLGRNTTQAPITREEKVNALFHGTMGAIFAVSEGDLASKEAILGTVFGLCSALSFNYSGCGFFMLLASHSESTEKANNIFTALVMGIISGNIQEGPSLLGGLLGAATVLSWGGGPIAAVFGGALTSGAIKASTGLAWKIQRVVSRMM